MPFSPAQKNTNFLFLIQAHPGFIDKGTLESGHNDPEEMKDRQEKSSAYLLALAGVLG